MEGGSFTISAIKYFQGETIELDRVANIQTAKDLEAAFDRISMMVENKGYSDELYEKIAKLDPNLAKDLENNIKGGEEE